MDDSASKHRRIKQYFTQVAFYCLHTLFVLSLLILIIIAYGTMREDGFPGIIFALPPFILLAQTAPHLSKLSKQTKGLLAQSIATFPSLAGVMYFIIVAFSSGLDSNAAFIYLMTLSISVVTSCVLAYRMFKDAIAFPQIIYVASQSQAAERHKRTRSENIMILIKTLFLLLFLLPVAIGIIVGILQSISSIS